MYFVKRYQDDLEQGLLFLFAAGCVRTSYESLDRAVHFLFSRRQGKEIVG